MAVAVSMIMLGGVALAHVGFALAPSVSFGGVGASLNDGFRTALDPSAPVLDPNGPGGAYCYHTCSASPSLWFDHTPSVKTQSSNELLVLVISDGSESSTPALTTGNISDLSGSTWNLASENTWYSSSVQYVFWAIDPSSGVDKVSVSTNTSAEDASALLFAVQAFNPVAPIDKIGSFASGYSATPSASVTTTLAGDLAVGILTLVPAYSLTTTPGWTAIGSASDTYDTVSYAEDEDASTVGAYTSAPAVCYDYPSDCPDFYGLEVIAIAGLTALTAGAPTDSVASVDFGQSVTFTAHPSGGTGTYPTYTWSGLPSGCTGVTTISPACTPTTGAGPYSVDYTVTDLDASTSGSSPTLSFTVYSDPETTTPVATPTAIDLGQTVSFSTLPSQGTGFYTTFTWGESSGLLGCTLVNAASITCTPTATGTTYQVTVKVTDTNGGSSSYETSADLVVASDPTASVPVPELPVASQPSADVGQLIQFSSTVGGGVGPYSYAWHGLPTGCVTSNNDPFSCTPSGTGTFSVYVVVTDANHYAVASGSLSYTVYSTPSTTSPVANHGSIDLGQPVTFSTTSSGGLAPYSYTWVGLPTGCVTADVASLTCTPTGTGTFSVDVLFLDANLYGISIGSFPFTVYADPTIGTPTANHPGADVGELVWFSATVNGGASPFSYVWHGIPKGCSSSNSDPLACTPTGTGTFSVYVVLTDANGWKVTSGWLSFKVYHGLDLDTPTVNHSPGHVGQSVTFTLPAVAGGNGPYTYSWNGLPGGCVSANSAQITCTLTTPTGTYHVSVTVSDANGAVKTSAKLKFVVEKALVPDASAHGGVEAGAIAQIKFGE